MKLLDQVRTKIKFKHYSKSTETNYVLWIKQFILFHHKKHPKDIGKFEIEQFLSHLATQRNVAASTQNQAFNALIFLYNQIKIGQAYIKICKFSKLCRNTLA